jgi:type II secretory pathway pseudopilin PulG
MKEQKGFSLLELIVSCTMLGFVILGLAMIFPAATQSVTKSRIYTRAINLAQERLQEFERINSNSPDSALITAGNHGPETIDIYTREWNVVRNSPLPNMRMVTMRVHWSTGASIDTVTVVTYLDR